MFKLQEEIYKLGKAHRACADLEDVTRCTGEDQLAELMFKHFTFCFKNDFPGAAVMKANSELLAKHGILSARGTVAPRDLKKYILTGDAQLNITVSGSSVVFIYAKDRARINITVRDNAIVSFR